MARDAYCGIPGGGGQDTGPVDAEAFEALNAWYSAAFNVRGSVSMSDFSPPTRGLCSLASLLAAARSAEAAAPRLGERFRPGSAGEPLELGEEPAGLALARRNSTCSKMRRSNSARWPLAVMPMNLHRPGIM